MEWIKLTPENRPKRNQWVLVTYWNESGNHTAYARYDEYLGKFRTSTEFEANRSCGFDIIYNVTHWATLPEPAEDEECLAWLRKRVDEMNTPKLRKLKFGGFTMIVDDRPIWF